MLLELSILMQVCLGEVDYFWAILMKKTRGGTVSTAYEKLYEG